MWGGRWDFYFPMLHMWLWCSWTHHPAFGNHWYVFQLSAASPAIHSLTRSCGFRPPRPFHRNGSCWHRQWTREGSVHGLVHTSSYFLPAVWYCWPHSTSWNPPPSAFNNVLFLPSLRSLPLGVPMLTLFLSHLVNGGVAQHSAFSHPFALSRVFLGDFLRNPGLSSWWQRLGTLHTRPHSWRPVVFFSTPHSGDPKM